MFSVLLRDRWFQPLLAIWIATTLFYLVPSVPRGARIFFGDYVLSLTFLPFTILALCGGLRTLPSLPERRFWKVIAAAFGVWLAYAIPYFWVPDTQWSLSASVLGDCAYLGFYLLFLLAIDLRPHLQTMNALEEKERRLRSIGLSLLLFGWLSYLVVIPASLQAAEYQSELPSFLVYLSLDLLLVARLVWVRRESWSVRWATLYGVLAGAMAVQFVADLLESLYVAGVIELGSGTFADMVWTMPFVMVATAARLRHAPFGSGQDVLNQDWGPLNPLRAGVVLMAGAIVLPIAHHTAYALGIMDPRTERYRDIIVESILVALALLAILSFRLLERERRLVESREQGLRKELDQARRMDAVARVAGAVAHDFNNMLHVIRGRVDLASDALPPGHPGHDDLREIRSAAMRASAMAGDLLTFGRRQPVATEPQRLHDFINTMRRQLKLMAGDNVALTITLRATHDSVAIDPIKFERVLLNLIANSRNAMPGGGRLEIETWNPAVSSARVCIAVRDTGQGMSAEVLDRAFEPFFTTRREEGGSGMGLASALGIVQAMGGTIRAQSEPGHGTSVVIELPVEAAPPATTPAPRPHGALLIVEIDPHMRQMLRGYFSDIWKPVLTTGNAMEALQIAGTAGQRIGVLVTDTSPSGLTHEALIARLREMHRGLKVVLIVPEGFTGSTVEGAIVVPEPLSLETLAETVKTLAS